MTPAAEAERLSRGEWTLGGVLAFVGAGITVGSPALIAAAAVPLVYLLGTLLGTGPPATIQIHRRFAAGDAAVVADGAGSVTAVADEDTPDANEPWYGSPGDIVTVRTTVRNTGPNAVVDLRLVDGVPATMSVVDGTHRTCVTLESGAETTIEYSVRLPRGEYVFDELTVRTRDYTGTIARTWDVAVGGDREIHCARSVDQIPLADGRHDYAGQVPTDEGGRGVEFYSVREYETGDPVSAIEWRRYANTRELATVEYRTERSTRVVCLVDARQSQYQTLTKMYPAAIELSTDAAVRTFRTLLSEGHPVGIVGLHGAKLSAVAPGTDTATRRRVRELLGALRGDDNGDSEPTRRPNSFQTPEADENVHSDDDPLPAGDELDDTYTLMRGGDPIANLPAAIPGETLVYLFSSFVDDQPTEAVELLRSHGYSVRVVAPDVVGGDDTAARLATLARETRLSTVRATGAAVVDWDLDRPLELVLRETFEEGAIR